MGVSKKRKTLARKRTDGASEPPPVGPPSEFWSLSDDAWYGVNLVLHGETLVVKYREFVDPDEEFHAADFTTAEEVSTFRRRFRPLSKQLEASDCWMVEQGIRVCALRVCAEDGSSYYYDAIVEGVDILSPSLCHFAMEVVSQVKREEHTTVNGVEKCSCSVVLSWLHGPEARTMTSALVENLCTLESCAQLDPRLACFLHIAKWKNGIISSSKHEDLCLTQKPQSATMVESALSDDEEIFGYERNEDVDLGGGDRVRVHIKLEEKTSSGGDGVEDRLVEDVSYMDLKQRDDSKAVVVHSNARYFILVENLEKDISPSTIVNFVWDATSVEVKAFVFLRLPLEPYTYGTLVVDSPEKLDKLCDFVAKQDQIIVSSNGRPWITSTPSPDFVQPPFCCLEPNLKKTSPHSTDKELQIVKLGSEEYRKAEKLRELYKEFTEHQELMFKSLAREEENIFNDSDNSFGSN